MTDPNALTGVIIILILIFFILGYALGYQAGKPPPCKHSTRTTTFYHMQHLRDLFSGNITPEEYDQRTKDMPMSESKCCDCGKIL